MRTSTQAGRFFTIIIIFAVLWVPGRGMAQQNKQVQHESLNVDSAKFYINKGNTLRQSRKIEDALRAYEKARTFQPANQEAITGVMAANFGLNRVDDGLKVLDEWVKLEPNNTQAWFYVGMAQAETNHPEAALKAFSRLVDMAPDSVGYRVGQIQMLVELKRWDEAVKACDKVIQMHPVEGVLVWSLKAYSLAGLGKYDEAVDVINKTVELYPNSMEAIYNRACIYAIKGDKVNALTNLKKAIEMDPNVKHRAIEDKDFKNLYNDEDFKKLTFVTNP